MKKFVIIIVSMLFTITANSQTLIHHWPLNSNFNDSVGGQNLFAPITTPANSNTPQITPSDGVYFDGSGDWLSGPTGWAPFWGNSSSIPYGGDTTFMISMWVKIDGSNGDSLYNGSEQFVSIGFQRDVNNPNQITFGAQANNQNNPSWGFPENGQMAIQTISSNYIRTQIQNPDPDTFVRPFMKDEWVHLVYNHNKSFYFTDVQSLAYPDFYSIQNFTFYKNGDFMDSGINSSGVYSPCTPCGIPIQYLTNPASFPLFSSFAVGAAKDVSVPGTNKFFKGWIKDIRIYIGTGNLAIDTVFVKNLYNNPPVFTNTSEPQNNKTKIKYYPNPSNTGYFTIEMVDFGKNTQYTVTDLSGKSIKSDIINDEKTFIDLSKNTKGMYFIRIQNQFGIISTTKLIYQ